MSERALIIAIERYDKATEGFTAKELDGTLQAALDFRDWLQAKWRAEGTDGIVLVCSEPKQPGQRGASGRDIVDALIELETAGRDQTDALFVYFSGHGFRLAGETIQLADVLVAADFEDVKRSAASCFKLDALVDGLRSSLGYGMHFYFIDACRNEVEKAVGSNIMPFSGQGSDIPSTFLIQSTVPNAPALVGGPFAKLLLAGLQGAGKAKVWEPPVTDSMKVRFDSLRRFLKDGLKNTQPITQATDGEKGESEAVLATIKPVPPIALKLVLRTSLAPLRGRAEVTAFNAAATTSHPIAGDVLLLRLPPNHYRLAISIDGGMVTPAGPLEVELYDDRELTFDVAVGPLGGWLGGLEGTFGAGPVGAVPAAPAPNACVEVPPGSQAHLRHLGSGHETTLTLSDSVSLPAGTYGVTLRDSEGRQVRRQEVAVGGSGVTEIAPARWQGSLALESIAPHFPQHGGGVDFSEALGGAISDPDLGVWLAILGGGRILGPWGDYSKIGPLPLSDFSGEPPGASPVYLLAGVHEASTQVDVATSAAEDDDQLRWLGAGEPSGLAGLREAVLHPAAGQCFVSIAVGSQPALTLASFASPNRCTLIVVTFDVDGQPRIGQYLLPLGHLTHLLEPRVREILERRNQLRDVHLLALLSRAFRRRRRLSDEFGVAELESLLYAKWLDPIGASLATYECVRRRQLLHALPEVAHNMETYFGDLPDTAAIARLAGRPAVPRGVPLFLDGVKAFTGGSVSLADLDWLPFSAQQLDFTSPWTAWRGAVESPMRSIGSTALAGKRGIVRRTGAADV